MAEHLPELAAQQILKGFEGEEPILVPRKNSITLRYVSARNAPPKALLAAAGWRGAFRDLQTKRERFKADDRTKDTSFPTRPV